MTDYGFRDKSISQLKAIVRERLDLDIKELRSFGDLRKRETWEKIVEQHLLGELDLNNQIDELKWITATTEDCCCDQKVATYKGWDISVFLPNGGIVAMSVHREGAYWQASTEHLEAWMQIDLHVKLAKRFIDSREDENQTWLDQVEAARRLKTETEYPSKTQPEIINAKAGCVPISFGKTLEQLMSGQKTVTRRTWKDDYAQGFVRRYSLGITDYPAFNKDRRYGGREVGIISLICPPYQEYLLDMPDSDLAREGFPNLSRAEFVDQFFQGNSKLKVWVVRFKFLQMAIARSELAELIAV